ncbi:uncharacterized protein LOC121408709 [Lytechinus variegatus]|uniref:uncharacterized protein LOC121408709 n=2 Tax=Lytechinus variegatus TaxID=7654 RepID=UPI001BB2CD2C|nr:uncharacterized protein LOC121408709 [Lytechinus variegatus]
MSVEKVKSLRLQRRGAKAKLSRYGKALQSLINDQRPVPEVQEMFEQYAGAFDDLQNKHASYTEVVEDDDEFEKEELWMDECHNSFMKLQIIERDYCKVDESFREVTQPQEHQQGASARYYQSLEATLSADEQQDESPREAGQPADAGRRMKGSAYKMERPKLPSFDGNIRDYCIFKADFLHAVGNQYDDRDALMILRSCLQSKPLQLVKGIGQDYTAAWEQLDMIYGDERFVADAIINDISKVRPLKTGESDRFCEFVHLVRRSYNTLKEINQPGNLDNSHMLAIMEKKLSPEDRLVWFRHQETCGKASFDLFLTWLTIELKSRMRASAPVRSDSKSGGVHIVGKAVPNEETKFQPFHKCWICETSSHWLDQCKKFLAMSQIDRLQLVKTNHACFSCLKKAGKEHRMSNCKRRRRCSETSAGEPCKYFHHPLLHASTEVRGGNVDVAFAGNSEALLPIVTVEILGQRGAVCEGNVLLDSGAQVSLIKKSVAEELKLKGSNISITITKVGGEQEQMETQQHQLKVKSLSTNAIHSVTAVALPCISENIAEVKMDAMAKLFNLKSGDLRRGSGSVHLLIGIDYPKMHMGKSRQKGQLAARKSPLGWVIFGAPKKSSDRMNVLHVKLTTPIDLTDFWSSESMGVQSSSCHCEPSPLSKQEKEEEQIIRESSKKVGNKWEIAYPWRKDPNLLPDNRAQAEKVLCSTEKRLARNQDHADAYVKQMKELVENGFARKLTENEVDQYEGPIHYISHHAVLRPEKRSTPVRIVFNSSSSYHGHCLNDYWFKGPDLLNDLLGVLLRFRMNEVGFCGDISKMYHRVSIPERDMNVHRYLWRDMQTDRKPDVYIMKVVTFGDKPAPAMAQLALRMTAEAAEATHPKAAQVLKESVYMDDICDSVREVSEAEQLTSEIDQVLQEGGFKVKGWTSNEALKGESKKEGETRILEAALEDKVLGIAWDNQQDMFFYKVKETVPSSPNDGKDEESLLTKRKVLSRIARIFDPIGFAAPVLVRAKIGMQQLWQRGYDWDELLPSDQQKWWVTFLKEMQDLNNVKYERCLTPPMAIGQPTLCIFADASEVAFGVCVYLQWKLEDGKYAVRFVLAKSRVAPLKKITVPRLELQAAVMAARVYTTVMKELRLQPESVIFMTDSMIALSWIRSEGRRFKPFVAARIGEIQSHTNPAQWKYVPGELNPADDVSRGLPVKKLSERWKQGPAFLYRPKEEWPSEKAVPDTETEVESERRKVNHISAKQNDVIDVKKFSSWRKLIRVTAYVLKFVEKLKAARWIRSDDNVDPDERCLSTAQLQKAERFLIKEAQTTLHQRVKNGDFKTLSPFVDKEGIIRVGGRLDKAQISYEQRHPALLPYGAWISTLITRHMHQLGHGGVAATAAKIRRQYWILQIHKLAKTVKYRCVMCRRMEHQVESQVMSDLPDERVAPFTPPFYFSSVDYFGPISVKVGRNKTAKHYGVLFSCLNTRAIHLEVAVDCTSMEFMQVLRRFFAMRGQPAFILSDNGTQFVGTERELREMVQGWSSEELRDFCAERGTTWKFTTPSAPHHNGCAEALVKSCKIALKKAIGDQLLTPFELHTCLQEVANLVNQRPIGRAPNDPDDGTYLCPNDLLLGRSSSAVPQGPFRETKNPRHRFEFVQRIVDAYWKSWMRDVFPLLVPRRKWNNDRRNVRIDDVVILADHNAVRGKWTLGRIIQVYPGTDGKVRTVKVKSKGCEYKRPISKIVVIYPTEGYDDE